MGNLRSVLIIATAVVAAPILTAQTPPRPATTADALKLTGCLKMEKEVPGLKPNVAERAGVTDDYILTNAMLAKDSRVSGIAVAGMYEIEGIPEDQLRSHVNHHVEVDGRIGKPGIEGDAPDFNATSVRMLAATCPAAK
jgi:hypothetical protein